MKNNGSINSDLKRIFNKKNRKNKNYFHCINNEAIKHFVPMNWIMLNEHEKNGINQSIHKTLSACILE